MTSDGIAPVAGGPDDSIPHMPSFFFRSRVLGSIVLAAVIAAAVWLGALLSISDFDPATLRTVRTVTEGGGTLVETRFNPVGVFLAIAVIATVACVVALLLVTLVRLARRCSTDQLTLTRETLRRELANVLASIRTNLTTKETYARSLADAQMRLAGLAEAEQVRVIVSLLIAENERMRLASDEDKRKLEASRHKIGALQASLHGAKEAALKDPLTGVGNRRLFDVALQKAFEDSDAHQTPLSVVMCDIDHFKRVNDSFGHQIGDEILSAFSRIVESSVRETDTVTRYGGEEFAIILPRTEQEAAKVTAEHIRSQFGAKQFSVRRTGQKIGPFTASFGVAQRRSGEDVGTFVRRADAKLYEAKANGRDRVAVFSESE